jgi:hypothetical protein
MCGSEPFQHLATLGLVVGSAFVRLADDTAADQMIDAEVGVGIVLTITTPLPPNPGLTCALRQGMRRIPL